MILADRLAVPDRCRAILWDMDGVLLDTLGLDLVVCNQLLQRHFGPEVSVGRSFIRSIFAYHAPEFWRRILEQVGREFGASCDRRTFQEVLAGYNTARTEGRFDPCPGIKDILESAQRQGLISAVVSNNPTKDVRRMLDRAGLSAHFQEIVGNDLGDLQTKPAPDTYLLTAQRIGVEPIDCVVVEDSLIGVQAGRQAGCFTVGVATGGTDLSALEACGEANSVYFSFKSNQISLKLGEVTNKEIRTPNEFVSHMIEHIAWRTGCEIRLTWNNTDWSWLGSEVGQRLGGFERQADAGAALGMIDDGSAEVVVERAAKPGLELTALPAIDLPWFLSSRCEQLDSGNKLVAFLEGFAQGYGARIQVRICTLEDPHHTWEGVFRSLGIALGQMLRDADRNGEFPFEDPVPGSADGAVKVHQRSIQTASVSRATAESEVEVSVDFGRSFPSECQVEVSSSVKVDGLARVISIFVEEAGCSVRVRFCATRLSSSHVVLEDTALVLGRALKEILVLRMERFGANCAGSSLDSPESEKGAPIRAAISVEGRKFWRFVPFEVSSDQLKREMIIGHTVLGGLFSEDLDDFIDGLAGGLGCSVVVHVKRMLPPEEAWTMVFRSLGKAVRQTFAMNRRRKGVPPGVKATLS